VDLYGQFLGSRTECGCPLIRQRFEMRRWDEFRGVEGKMGLRSGKGGGLLWWKMD